MPRLLFCLAASALAGGCLLTTDLDGFANRPGVVVGDSGPDSAPTDASKPAFTDPDAQSSLDAGDGSGADPSLIFQDDFDRGDGPVGNGWIDNRNRYQISNKQIPVSGSDYVFQGTYLYRPKSDERDIKASIEFTPFQQQASYPQVHIRSTPGDGFTCYAIGVPNTDSEFFFGRCVPGDFVAIGSQPLTENLVIGKTYRLSISARGTDPVHLVTMLEKKIDGGFKTIGRNEFDDTAPERVKNAGMFGISADGNCNWVYDNFTATKITE